MADASALGSAAHAPPGAPDWLDLLRSEVAPTPGRLNATIRIVVATVIVLVTSLTLEVPFADLSIFIVMFLTMASPEVTARNSVFVAIAAAVAVVVVTLSIGVTILILRFTIDYPPARLGAMALFCFAGMYVARILPSRAVGFLLAIVVFVSQAYVDLFPSGEAGLRAVLWVWVAAVYPAIVTAVVNFTLLPADPGPLLRREASQRLRAVARAATVASGSIEARSVATSLAAYAQRGAAPLRKLLALSEMRHPSTRPMHAERVARIDLVDRLVASAAWLLDAGVEPSAVERSRLARVAASCEQFADAIDGGADELRMPVPAPIDDAGPMTALAPVIGELERLVHELPLAERPEADRPAEAERPIAADALTNPRYAQFAAKVTLAAMLCYIAYTAVDWFGIHTCMITCVIVALGSAGATIQKSTLRVIGCLLGGGLALA
ncbi:MAG TPA: FUSC family protein, partial [Caldimonas sp.]|nr:FUSC family protein [Caldimonas sp.]